MSYLMEYTASFSDNVVHNAIEQAVWAEKESFIDMLKTVQSVLEKSQGKLKECLEQFAY